MLLLPFLLGFAQAQELARAVNRLYASAPQVFLGSRESLFGGISLPRDSRFYAGFQHRVTPFGLYYMNGTRQPLPRAACPDTSPLAGIEQINGWPPAWLDCLLRANQAPTQLETGLYYGRVESWLDNNSLTSFANKISGGTILAETKCDGVDRSSGLLGFTQLGLASSLNSWNYIADVPIGDVEIYPPEDIPGRWWWMDATVDFAEVCPSRVPDYYDTARVDQQQLRLTGGPGLLFHQQQYTAGSFNGASRLVNTRVGQLREVGYDKEAQATLFLGRLLTQFAEGYRVTAFFTLAKRNTSEVQPAREAAVSQKFTKHLIAESLIS